MKFLNFLYNKFIAETVWLKIPKNIAKSKVKNTWNKILLAIVYIVYDIISLFGIFFLFYFVFFLLSTNSSEDILIVPKLKSWIAQITILAVIISLISSIFYLFFINFIIYSIYYVINRIFFKKNDEIGFNVIITDADENVLKNISKKYNIKNTTLPITFSTNLSNDKALEKMQELTDMGAEVELE